jgi:hypothetical protein
MYNADGGAYIQVVPEKIGKLQLTVVACFADGVPSIARTDAEVVLPERVPEKFLVARGGTGHTRTAGTIEMDLTEMFNKVALDPLAVYKGADHPVPIPGKYVTFKVISAAEDEPPISIDNTGRISALHIGHALIQTTFQGLSTLTCVDVISNARFGGSRTVCRELVPEGMTAPTTGIDPNGRGPRVKPLKQP